MSKGKKEEYGQYFTSETIASFMVSLISKNKENLRILDPGAGAGVFLKALKENNYTNLHAYELDEDLFEIIEEKYSFFDIKLTDFLQSSKKEKFDIIIGNPPYVHWNDIKKSTMNIINTQDFWKPLINGEWDLLYAFIIWSVEKLKENGELIFIVPYYWFNSTHAYSLREHLVASGYFELIIHMGEYKLFSDCAPNNIIFKFIKSKKESNDKAETKIRVIEYNERTGDLDDILEKIKEFINRKEDFNDIYDNDDFRFFFQDNFSNSLFWSLLHEKEKLIIADIEKASLKYVPLISLKENLGTIRKHKLPPALDIEEKVPITHILDSKDIKHLNLNMKSLIKLKENYYSRNTTTKYLKLKQILNVGVGMVTGFDEAFVVDEDFLDSLSIKENELITQFIKGRSCRRFWMDKPIPYIIAEEVESEEILKENYSNIYNHLIKHRTALDKRYKKKSTQFYQWATIRNLELFKKNLNNEKLFVPCLDRHKKSRYSYTKEPYYGSGDVLIISKKEILEIKESLKYICAWLNSEKLNLWYKLKGSKRGHRTAYTQTRVEEIPIRLINWENPGEVKIYNNIITLFDEISEKKDDYEDLDDKMDGLINKLIF